MNLEVPYYQIRNLSVDPVFSQSVYKLFLYFDFATKGYWPHLSLSFTSKIFITLNLYSGTCKSLSSKFTVSLYMPLFSIPRACFVVSDLISEHVMQVEWEKTSLQELDITATDLSTECLIDMLSRIPNLRFLSAGQLNGFNDSVSTCCRPTMMWDVSLQPPLWPWFSMYEYYVCMYFDTNIEL